jgi:hypothetical protein
MVEAAGVEAAKSKTLKVPIKDSCQGSSSFLTILYRVHFQR